MIAIALLVPATGFANELPVQFGKSGSVSVVQAKALEGSGGRIDVSGVLKRRHRLPIAGHLHVYVYSEEGDLLIKSQHRVPKLNSRRSGSIQVPFSFTVEGNPGMAEKVALVYHSPGFREEASAL